MNTTLRTIVITMTCTLGVTLGISSGYHSHKEHQERVAEQEQIEFERAVSDEVRTRLWRACESEGRWAWISTCAQELEEKGKEVATHDTK